MVDKYHEMAETWYDDEKIFSRTTYMKNGKKQEEVWRVNHNIPFFNGCKRIVWVGVATYDTPLFYIDEEFYSYPLHEWMSIIKECLTEKQYADVIRRYGNYYAKS